LKDVCIGDTVNLEFETRSEIGNLISSSNDVSVLKPDGTNQVLTSTGLGGKYSIEFTFDQTSGTATGYQFFVTSSAQNHLTSEKTSSVFINALRDNCGVAECVRSDKCPQGHECKNNKCVPIGGPDIPWTLILIASLIVIIIIIVLIVLFVRKKRKPQFGSDVSIGDL